MDFNKTKRSRDADEWDMTDFCSLEEPDGEGEWDLEEWDLVAWPKRGGLTSDPFDRLFERQKYPTIDGVPMNVGYVREVGEAFVRVERLVDPREVTDDLRSPRVQGKDEVHPVVRRRREIYARLEREHNERYQHEKEKDYEKRALNWALTDWHDQPLWYRLGLTLIMHRSDWIEQRKKTYEREMEEPLP